MNEKPASESPSTAEDLDALRERAAKADEYLELARRAKADFLNYQDRMLREKGEWKREALQDFVADFLPALDSFSWAAYEEPTLMEGLKVVEREFLRVLAKHDLYPVEAAGEDFDPSRHEAVGSDERDDVPPGKVIEQVRRGWRIGEKVLRPAAVRISKAKEPQDSEGRT